MVGGLSSALARPLAAVAVAAGCGIGDASDAMLATIDTLPNGAVHVTIDPGARARVPQWRLVEELRIGAVEGTGPEVFGDARSIAVDDAGRLYVLEAQAQEIRVFEPDGTHLRTVGRKGGGPGEFQRANGLAAGPGGVIYAYDEANQRLTALHAGGDSVVSHALHASFFGWVWDGQVDERGRVHERVNVMGEEGEFVRRFDPATGRADTFALATPPPPARAGYVSFRTDRGGGSTSIGFAPGSRRRFDPSGQPWTTFTSRYVLYRHDLESGDTLRIVEFQAPLVAVTGAERAGEIARIDSFAARYGRTWDQSLVPQQKPAIERFDFDEAGRLWVRITSPDSLIRFDIIDPAGRLLATASTDVRFWSYDGQVVITDRALHAIARDDLDVPYIVRARIERDD